MAKVYRVYQVDSFTKKLFTGNPAGVVANADGLTAVQMLQIAREFNNSETAFLLSPDSNDHDVHVRFFTPHVEVPSCGHATIAAHYVRAVENKMETGTVIQKIGIGILPVEIFKQDGNYKIYMTQGEIIFSDPLEEGVKGKVIAALGLTPSDIDLRCPVQVVSTGHSKLMVGIKSKQKLNSLKPDYGKLSALSSDVGSKGYFVFTLDSDVENILTHARMFAPSIGINEDPVTGNGNGPLGAYLVKHKLADYSGSMFNFLGKQGEAMGKPGIVEVSVDIKDGNPIRTRIGGNAVIVFKSQIEI